MYSPDKCVSCGAAIKADAEFCTKCGIPVPSIEENRCINQYCARHLDGFVFDQDDMYCDKCGKPTLFGNQVLKYT